MHSPAAISEISNCKFQIKNLNTLFVSHHLMKESDKIVDMYNKIEILEPGNMDIEDCSNYTCKKCSKCHSIFIRIIIQLKVVNCQILV